MTIASPTTPCLYTPAQAGEILSSGIPAVVAGTEELLRRLPVGNWIGGTMRYFMTGDGACESADEVLVVPMPAERDDAWIRIYHADELHSIVRDAPANGFSVAIVPARSPVHIEFAQRAPYLPQIFRTPLIGWISGVSLQELDSVRPLVFDGRTGEAQVDAAIVMHVRLPAGRIAHIDSVNIFEGDPSSDVLTFPVEGVRVETCLVNGQERNLARYLADKGIDTRLPLVADYAGVPVNTSFQKVDATAGRVDLYAPVFSGIEYRIAAPVADYVAAFREAAAAIPESPVFACNCILNYLYGDLEGRRVADVVGPMTFGEIAYQLLNQTLVYLSIVEE